MGNYAGYVIAAYALTAGGIGALIAWVVLGRRSARNALARAERTIARQSEARGERP